MCALSALQVLFVAGLAMQLLYMAYFNLWVVFAPLAAELTFILYLSGYKFFLELLGHDGEGAVQSEQSTVDIDAKGVGMRDVVDAPDSWKTIT